MYLRLQTQKRDFDLPDLVESLRARQSQARAATKNQRLCSADAKEGFGSRSSWPGAASTAQGARHDYWSSRSLPIELFSKSKSPKRPTTGCVRLLQRSCWTVQIRGSACAAVDPYRTNRKSKFCDRSWGSLVSDWKVCCVRQSWGSRFMCDLAWFWGRPSSKLESGKRARGVAGLEYVPSDSRACIFREQPVGKHMCSVTYPS